MKERFLDMSVLSLEEFNKIKGGYDLFISNTKKLRYFGYVDKKSLKHLNKAFGYVNPKTFLQGCAFGAGAIIVCGLYLNWVEEHEKKDEE